MRTYEIRPYFGTVWQQCLIPLRHRWKIRSNTPRDSPKQRVDVLLNLSNAALKLRGCARMWARIHAQIIRRAFNRKFKRRCASVREAWCDRLFVVACARLHKNVNSPKRMRSYVQAMRPLFTLPKQCFAFNVSTRRIEANVEHGEGPMNGKIFRIGIRDGWTRYHRDHRDPRAKIFRFSEVRGRAKLLLFNVCASSIWRDQRSSTVPLRQIRLRFTESRFPQFRLG